MLSSQEIQQLVHDLDPNYDIESRPAACIVLDVTLNADTYNPKILAARHGCTIQQAREYMSNLHKYQMLEPHWLNDQYDIDLVSFWLHVLLAMGKVSVKYDNT